MAARAYVPHARGGALDDYHCFLLDPKLARNTCGKTVADAGPTTTRDRRVAQRLTVYGVAGHMHLRGRDISIVLDPGTARQRTLLHIPAWDFRWQDAYYLRGPVAIG